MKVLITGGTGFLGRHLVWRTAAEGNTVTFTGRNPQAAKEVIQISSKHVEWRQLEHGTPAAEQILKTAAQDADAIIHCAALSSPWGKPDDFYRANVSSMNEVLNAAHAANVKRMIYVSTPSIYFEFKDDYNIKEDAILPTPANKYAQTKRVAEELLLQNPLQENVILRPRALFGPWDTTLFPRLLRAIQSRSFPLIRDGNIILDLTCIDNAVDAIWLALTKPLPRQVSTYNVSNGEPRRLSDLLHILAKEFNLPLRTRKVSWRTISVVARLVEWYGTIKGGKEPIFTRYTAGVLAFSQTLDIDALRSELGYKPAISIDEGIRQYAKWWHQQTKNNQQV